jgi:hypothetical protein
MMKAVPEGRARYRRLALRAVMSAGEAVGDAVFAYTPRRARRHGQRDVRPDRDQLHRRQLRG